MPIECDRALALIAAQTCNDNRVLVLYWAADLDFSTCIAQQNGALQQSSV